MVRPTRMLQLAAALCVVFAPAVALANDYYLCVSGPPLSTSSVSDPTAQTIITDTCNDDPSCCAVRWSLHCVVEAAAHTAGDFCGRQAWTQGPLPQTAQRYPRDFNLFAFGTVGTGVDDVDNAIATGVGFTALRGFNLDRGPDPVALVSKGYVTLTNGTPQRPIDSRARSFNFKR
jgi:hypothetical protein